MFADGPYTVTAAEDIPTAGLRIKLDASFDGALSGAADGALDIGTARAPVKAGETLTILPRNKEGSHEFVASAAITGTEVTAAAAGKVATGAGLARMRRSPAGTAANAVVEAFYI